MSKAVSFFTALVMVLLVSGCRASQTDINEADHFFSGLSSLKDASPVSDMDTLAQYSASVIDLSANAIDFKTGWEKNLPKYQRYNKIFGSDGTQYIYISYDKLDKVTYTFSVSSKSDIYNAAEDMTVTLGKPVVTLNSAGSSQSDVKSAIANSKDPDLRYCYEWLTDLEGHHVYIYMAYYYAKGVNFAYFVVSKPNLSLTNDISPVPAAS